MLQPLNHAAIIANRKPIRTLDYSLELQQCDPAALPAIYHGVWTGVLHRFPTGWKIVHSHSSDREPCRSRTCGRRMPGLT